jgi:hypothetical protein
MNVDTDSNQGRRNSKRHPLIFFKLQYFREIGAKPVTLKDLLFQFAPPPWFLDLPTSLLNTPAIPHYTEPQKGVGNMF